MALCGSVRLVLEPRNEGVGWNVRPQPVTVITHGEVTRNAAGKYQTHPRGNLARTSTLPYWMLYLPFVLILALMTGLITVLPLLLTVHAVWIREGEFFE